MVTLAAKLEQFFTSSGPQFSYLGNGSNDTSIQASAINYVNVYSVSFSNALGISPPSSPVFCPPDAFWADSLFRHTVCILTELVNFKPNNKIGINFRFLNWLVRSILKEEV